MIVRKAYITDIESIVNIHCDAFKDFFLTSLGSRFLYLYYSCFIKSSETITVCVEEHGTIVGFAAITKKCRGFNSRLIKSNFLKFCLISLNLLFSSPRSLLRLLKNLRKIGNNVNDNENYAELYSIGVYSEHKNKGIGKKLLLYSEKLLKEEGVERLSLTTDYNDNEYSIRFYRSMGYDILYEFVTYPSRRMYRLHKYL